jgi:hypothetical protein
MVRSAPARWTCSWQGRERRIDNGAEFAVHSWRDRQGREARDFAADAAPNRNYLDYYREMGMDPAWR